MRDEKEPPVIRRDLPVLLKVFGTLGVLTGLLVGLFAAIEFRGGGFEVAATPIALGVQLFFFGMMMLAAAAALDFLHGIRDALNGGGVESRRYGRTRSNRGALLAAKLAAEPVPH
ncbi:MAG: hypothetical protein HKM95_17670 [Inquilinus sp.]|nr:hypothetical protein [Inquilinus sp.]